MRSQHLLRLPSGTARAAWLAALLIGLVAPLASSKGLVKADAAFEPAAAAPGDVVDLVVTAVIAPGYHVYAPDSPSDAGLPTSLETKDSVGLTAAGELSFPKPRSKYDDVFEVVVRLHEGTVEYRQPFRVAEGAAGTLSWTGTLDLQACDASSCTREQISLSAGLDVAAAAGGAPGGANAVADGAAEALPEPDPGLDPIAVGAAFVPATARAGETVTLKIVFALGAGQHFYAPDTEASMPTEIAWDGAEGLAPAGALRFPPPLVKYNELFEADERYYEERVVFEQDFTVAEGREPGPVTLTGKVTGQTCDDTGCQRFELPLRAALAVEAGPPRETTTAAAPRPDGDGDSAAPPRREPAAETAAKGAEAEGEEQGLGAFLALAVFWGLFTLLMPCTYPMIPITISFFTKQAIQRNGNVLTLALTYGAGIVLIFVLIGVLLGAPIIAFATHPVTNLVIGVLFLFFALALFGAIDLRPPDFLLAAAGKASQRGGLVGVFLMGATLVITSFTCTAPFVGSLLSVGATGGDLGRIALGMAVFGATMAVPFVLLSLIPGKLQRMPRAGDWMHTLKVFLGFVEVAAALKFFSNADLVWQWGVLSREVFLVLCVGTFFGGAAYLFGWIRLKDEADEGIGPVRMLGGLSSLLLAMYLSLGIFGFVLDDVTTAIIPNYSSERRGAAPGGGASESGSHRIVKDDLEAAEAAAKDEGKLLLLNFTGFTCAVCRQMEEKVFRRPEVARELAHYVEARLHTDHQDAAKADRWRALEVELADTTSNPVYVAVDPADGKTLGIHPGGIVGGDSAPFVAFLRDAVAARGERRTARGG